MKIEELEKKELLRRVEVRRPSDGVVAAGNKKFVEILSPQFGPQRMRGGYCQSNSICVVAAMREKGEGDWDIAAGYAFNTEEEDPMVHVWVRKVSLHYDPTWSLNCYRFSLEDCTYYEISQDMEILKWQEERLKSLGIAEWGKGILTAIHDLAKGWNLKVSIGDRAPDGTDQDKAYQS